MTTEIDDDHLPPEPQFQLECKVDVLFDAIDICRSIDPIKAIDLIKRIDAEQSSWEFTLLLANYFARERELATNAVPELVNLPSEQLAERLMSDHVASLKEDDK